MQDKLSILAEQQAELIRRYKALQAENARLLQANDNQRNELIRAHQELADLQQKYKQLQLAHALTENSPQRAQAKRKITQLIGWLDEAIEAAKE